MRNRIFGRIATAVVAITILVASAGPAAGQQPPVKKQVTDTAKKRPVHDTSFKRIKIGKETVGQAGGEVGLPLKSDNISAAIDSAVAAERDAAFLREQYIRESQRKLDSIAAAFDLRRAIARVRNEAANLRSRERADSTAAAEQSREEAARALKRHLARGFYFGVAGGASTPQRDLRNGYTGGWNTTVPVGWDDSNSPLGIRGDFSVDHLNGTRIHDVVETTTAASGDITVWSLNADLKLRMAAPGGSSRTNLYALGGFGAHRVVNGVYGVTGPNAGRDLSFGDGKTSFGWNVGAGMSAAWGPAEFFVESRFFHVKSDMAFHTNGGVGTYTSFLPVVVGVQWF